MAEVIDLTYDTPSPRNPDPIFEMDDICLITEDDFYGGNRRTISGRATEPVTGIRRNLPSAMMLDQISVRHAPRHTLWNINLASSYIIPFIPPIKWTVDRCSYFFCYETLSNTD